MNDYFGISDRIKTLTAPAGLEDVHQDGFSWARSGLNWQDTTRAGPEDWNRVIANFRSLLTIEGVDLSDLDAASPMILREALLRAILISFPAAVAANVEAVADAMIADPDFLTAVISATSSSPRIVPDKASMKALSVSGSTAALIGGAMWLLQPLVSYAGWIAADPGEHVVAVSTANAAYAWVRQYDELTPDIFDATLDGVADDAAAFAAMVAFAKVTHEHVYGITGKTARLESSIWFGTNDTLNSIRGAHGRGMEIVGACKDAPVFDLVGIENGRNVPVTGWRITGDAVDMPSCGILMGRPKQAAGVKSSGNALIENNQTFGYFRCAGFLGIQSESNDIRKNFFWNDGIGAAWTRFDYWADTFTMVYDAATAAFTAGQTITGGTSGATAKIVRPVNNLGGNTGKMLVLKIAGTFLDNETITDPLGGSATVNLPAGYTVMGPASPNTALGLEETSTNALHKIYANFFNNTDATSIDPVVFATDVTDWQYFQNNTNHENATAGTHVHLQQDQTRNAALSSGVSAFLDQNFLHNTHLYSITFGDPVSGGGTYSKCRIRSQQTAGSPSVIASRVKYVGPAAAATANCYDWEISSDFGIDLRGATFINRNTFVLADVNYGKFWADKQIEGDLFCDPSDVITITTSDGVNRLKLHYAKTGMQSTVRRVSATIAAGAITATAPIMLVETEGAAATDDLTTINLDGSQPVHGQIIALRPVSAARVTTVKITGGNIRGFAEVLLASTTQFVLLQYEATAAQWIIVAPQGNINASAAAGFTAMTGTATKTALATYAGQTHGAAYSQAAIQTLDDALKALSQRVKAIDDAMRAIGYLKS